MAINPSMHELGTGPVSLPEETQPVVDDVGRARLARIALKEAAVEAVKQAAQKKVAEVDLRALHEESFDVRRDQLPLAAIDALKKYWATEGVNLQEEWFPEDWGIAAEDILTTFSLGYTSGTQKDLGKDKIYGALDSELARVSMHVPESKAAFEWRPFVKAALRLRGDELAQAGDRVADNVESMGPEWEAIITKIDEQRPKEEDF